ncbi:chitosanase [Aquabacterium sp.]|uniref:chitosanase n=1 Tax=Aquabacterium sp. TaxID=1872578 RepID=UPI003D6D8410
MSRTRTILCDECERQKITLTLAGFDVLGCVPAPGRPGFCVISFEEAATPATEGVAGAAQPASVGGVAATAGETARAGVATPTVPAELTPLQTKTCEAIVNIFETGSVLGDYGMVTLIPGDTGGLTYGRSQTTLGSGNLAKLLQAYCANPGARFRQRLSRELPRFESKDATLERDDKVKNLMRACADDSVMREVQDRFFTQHYMEPARKAAQALGVLTPLGVAVVYDSFVHGSWKTIKAATDQQAGALKDIGEQAWIHAYVRVRRAWLASSARRDLRATVYRADAFIRLIELGAWGLTLPIVVRGTEVSQATLSGLPPGCYDGPVVGSRPLSLQQPLARGLDVRLLQLGLSERNVPVVADGVFGRGSVDAVRAYQLSQGLAGIGIADPALIMALTRDVA